MVSEYAAVIQSRMYLSEHKWAVDRFFIANQPRISETIRSTLIDWIVLIHINFKLLPETLFLAVNIVDRYISKVQISKHKVQLIGACSLLIAAKYEEIFPPTLKDLIIVGDESYTES